MVNLVIGCGCLNTVRYTVHFQLYVLGNARPQFVQGFLLVQTVPCVFLCIEKTKDTSTFVATTRIIQGIFGCIYGYFMLFWHQNFFYYVPELWQKRLLEKQ